MKKIAVNDRIIPMNYFNFMNIKNLLPTEKFSEKRVQNLMDTILEAGIWTVPICVETSTNAIMDGHHRWESAKRLGFSRIPCLKISYDEVKVISRRRNYIVTPEAIIQAALSNNLLPYKTTKHIFAFEIPQINIDLKLLF